MTRQRPKNLVPVPNEIHTRTVLPRLLAVFCMCCCLSVAVMGIAHIREAGKVFPSIFDPIMVLGESRWKVIDHKSNCLALARAVMAPEESRYRLHAQLLFPGADQTRLSFDLVFSPYQLLEQFQLDATFPDELLSVNNTEGALELRYRRLISEGKPVRNWESDAQKKTGKLDLPQPILLRPTDEIDRFALSYPPILNSYIAADGSEKIQFVPASDDQCVSDQQNSAMVKKVLMRAIEQFTSEVDQEASESS